ncbi:hypothetical protein CASFOL_039022 [Castilleja foliolosa]|uniref:Uncharacterized protein n=1 Tax=Castilleja foliolosa TaxID=1961234 RepID=A0ABD3BGT6_9LAMI
MMMSFNLEKKESEKHISVDPISLNPLDETTICISLPSSPRYDSFLAKQKRTYKATPLSVLSRQHSVALSNLERLKESHMRRSKSCGEGRACQPSLDFDLWPTTTTTNHQAGFQYQHKTQHQQQEENNEGEPENFKCGACLFLPGFSKGKTVKARKEEVTVERDIDIVSKRMSLEKFECGSWRSPALINYEDDVDITTTSNLFFDLPVELMRASSVNDVVSPVTTGFVFDNINNNNKDNHNHHYHNHSNRKGLLKNAASINHEYSSSSRQVRFSTSSPTLFPTSPTSPCITPRLRKARDEFSAFLEAQSV